ncbi:MAG: GNAT family N-acetyltransferase [Deltaproteobacteria bacterium]|nr:GNAT family N-acetyltransferase [Deltaproteobacteria bacterium]
MTDLELGLLEPLPWDTENFGFGVARWTGGELDATALRAAEQSGRTAGIRLVYVNLRPDQPAAERALEQVGATLVDRKTNFAKALDPATRWPAEVQEFAGAAPTAALVELALASGVRSRYLVDPKMPRACFETLYRLWIARSVARQIADTVLVVPGAAGEDGMVTLKVEDGHVARIGLIAVSAGCRGQGVGGKLLRAAEAWAVGRGCDRMEVITQGDNQQAVALYTRGGYTVDWTKHVWHWWLGQ